MSAATAYAKEIHQQLQRYATWLPTDAVKVGAVGFLQNNLFYKIGHLKDFNISFTEVRDPDAKATYKLMSSSTRELQVSGSSTGTAGGMRAAASLSISFSRANSIYFLLTRCVGSSVDDLRSLGGEILKRVETGEWKVDYVVVTRIITAGSATILQAQSRGASVKLEGDATGTPIMDLLKSGASVKWAWDGSFGLSVAAESKLTPLLSLGKVKYSFFDWSHNEPEFLPDTSISHSIGTTRLCSIVDSIAAVNLAPKTHATNDVNLKVKLPRHGDFIDVGDFLQFTSKATKSASTGGRATTELGKSMAVVVDLQPRFRIGGSRFRHLVDNFENVDWDPDATSEKHVTLNVRLSRSGSQIDIQPLIKLARQTVTVKPLATASARLSFEEIT
jgi:hypothetical protein